MRSSDLRLPVLALVSVVQVLLAIASPSLAVAVNGVVGAAWLVCWRVCRDRSWTVMWLLSLLATACTVMHGELRAAIPPSTGASPEHVVHVVTARTVAEGDRAVQASLVAVDDRRVARIPVWVFFEPHSTRWPPGTTLEVSGALQETGRFSAAAWRVFADDVRVIDEAGPLFRSADQMREAFLQRSVERGGDGGALLPGLALGDTQAVPASLEADMRVSALAHLVAVSGANSALVVGIVVFLTALCGGGIWWRLVIGVVALIGFVILVTPEPSIVRASVMATAALLAVVAGRPSRGIGVLSLAVWLLILLDPWRSVQFAFVLSVLATAGIVLGLAPMARVLARILPTWVAWAVSLPLVAQLAVQPVIILLRPTVPLYGVLANLVATPLAPLVTVLGLVGSVAGAIVPVVGDLAAWLGWWPAAGIAAIARTVASWPAAELPWVSGVVGAALMSLVTGLVWWAVVGRRPRVALVLAGAVAASVILTDSAPTIEARLTRPEHWQVAQCDVGQGDAFLVRTTSGVVAVDTGDDEEKLRRCLRVLGVNRVEILVLTHFDRDHVGQTHVFRGQVGTVLTGPPDNAEDRERLESLRLAGATIQPVTEGDQVTLGDYRLDIVWPGARGLSAPGNDSSVVVVFSPRTPSTEALSLVALGDLGERAQRMLQPRLAGLQPDIVKVSHHGSPDQSAELYADLDSPIALIGVGADNDYGHPAPRTLEMVGARGATIVRSDQDGIVTLHRDQGEIHIWREVRQ